MLSATMFAATMFAAMMPAMMPKLLTEKGEEVSCKFCYYRTLSLVVAAKEAPEMN